MTPVISLIVPVYNVEKYLNDCLQSVFLQTFSEWECICVNDGSTDRSLTILENWCNKDARFRIVDKKNGGLSSARNKGIESAKSEFIVFLDADDMLFPSFLFKMLDELMSAKLDIVGCSYKTFPNGSDAHYTFVTDKVVSLNELLGSSQTIQSSNDLCFVWRYGFRKSFLDKYALKFDERVRIGEDMIFMMKAVSLSKRIKFVDIPLYSYRTDNSSSLMRERTFRDFLEHDLNYIWKIKMGIANQYRWNDKTPFRFDAARYALQKFLPMLICNAKTKEDYSIDDVRRILSLNVIKDAISIVGFRNIYPSYKEYFFYLMMKLNISSIVYRYL